MARPDLPNLPSHDLRAGRQHILRLARRDPGKRADGVATDREGTGTLMGQSEATQHRHHWVIVEGPNREPRLRCSVCGQFYESSAAYVDDAPQPPSRGRTDV